MKPAGAIFDETRKLRYALWRIWDTGKEVVLFIGLNPSTADEDTDDPTIRRCMGFARDWGYGGVLMGNLYAYRATDPRHLQEAINMALTVVGQNDPWLARMHRMAGLTICAWGANATPPHPRCSRVAKLIGPAHCLGMTQGGAPRHPLYLPKTAKPIPYLPGQ